MVFGANAMGPAILATLGLSPGQVGRYRDCFVANGEIAVYTRNGCGNRECCHADSGPDDWDGVPGFCVGPSREVEVDEYVLSSGQYRKTGRRVMEKQQRCEKPDSAECGCTGCVVSHRLPKHPSYLRDRDDDFDCTYCTTYFSFPPEFAEELKRLDSGENFDPSARWLAAFDALRGA